MHPDSIRRRHCCMPTAELLSLIVAVLLWIALLGTLAPND
jgi:hypothetical protein